MTHDPDGAHADAIRDQFTRQAPTFAHSPALHGDDIVALMTEAAAIRSDDRAIDLACGPGSVACALAARAAQVVGLDATPAMLDQARALAETRDLRNVEWRVGDIYATPYPDGAFDVVACRFAFHHFQRPHDAMAEMARLAAHGGRIVLCDGVASDDPAKAEAFNAMERWRDPSTVEFRTLGYLRQLFVGAGLGEPQVRLFKIPYSTAALAHGSFPSDDDRAGLRALLDNSVDGDRLGMDARPSSKGVRVAYHSAVLTAIKRADGREVE